MNRIAQLRKFFTASLLAVVLLMGAALSPIAPHALAAESQATNEISNFKGDSSSVNRSYHALQEAAHDFRQSFRDDITSGRRVPSGERVNSPKQAARTISKDTRSVFDRAADAVKDTLNPG